MNEYALKVVGKLRLEVVEKVAAKDANGGD